MNQHMENSTTENSESKSKKKSYTSTGNGIYGLAFIGSLVYYIQHAETFWMGALGFLKALVWPAFVIYELMKYLKM
ncbi:MAG: hypothetical protein M3R17_06205 [Bacteroidota bacterium]|nr:hypothetical protein [Bacteroidota bacterium]